MKILLFLLAIAAFFVGVVVLLAGGSAVAEIEAVIFFLMAAVFLIGSCIVEAVNAATEKLEESLLQLIRIRYGIIDVESELEKLKKGANDEKD